MATPKAFNDQVEGLDSNHLLDAPSEFARVVVKGETLPEVWEAIDKRMTELAPSLQLARMLTVASDVDGGAVVAEHLPGRKFILFRAKTSPGLMNLCNRLQILGDRQTGKNATVIRQVFVLLDEVQTRFQEGQAIVDFRVRVVPMGILGRIPKDHLQTAELRAYLADWIAGRDLGPFQGEIKF